MEFINLAATDKDVLVSIEFLAHVFRETVGIKSREMPFCYMYVEFMSLDLRPYVFICL